MATPYPTGQGIYGPVATFTTQGVQPPATGYLGPADQLSIQVLSPNAPFSFSVSLRYLDLKGNVQPLLVELAGDATGVTPNVTPVQLAEGFLLSAVAFNGTTQRGQCWVQFLVLRQKAAAAVVVADVLLQGYVTTVDYVAWPGTPIASALDGRGALLTYPGGGGGVDTAVTLTVPPGVRWHVLGVSWDAAGFPASTDAIFALAVQDATGNVTSAGAGPIGVLISGPGVTTINFNALATFIATGPIAGCPMSSDVWVKAGYVLTGLLSDGPTGITYGNMQVSVEEYVEV